MPARLMAMAWPGEYGPNVVIEARCAKSSRRRAYRPTAASRATAAMDVERKPRSANWLIATSVIRCLVRCDLLVVWDAEIVTIRD